jgi:hypothetical protein
MALRHATQWFTAVLIQMAPEETMLSREQEECVAFRQALDETERIAYAQRLFYPENIFQSLDALLKRSAKVTRQHEIMISQIIKDGSDSYRDPELRKFLRTEAEKILAESEAIIGEVRARLGDYPDEVIGNRDLE